VLTAIADYLFSKYKARILLRGIIYAHSINEPKMRGSDSLSLSMFKELCGPDFYKKVVLMLTWWDALSPDRRDQARKNALDLFTQDWDKILPSIEQVVWLNKTQPRNDALKILIDLIERSNTNDSVRIQRQLDQGIDLKHTGAGMVLYKQLNDAEKRFEGRMIKLADQYKDAMDRQDTEHAQRLSDQMQDGARKLYYVYSKLDRLEHQTDRLQDRNEALQERNEDLQEDLRDGQRMQQRQLDRLEEQTSRLQIQNEALQEQNEAFREDSREQRRIQGDLDKLRAELRQNNQSHNLQLIMKSWELEGKDAQIRKLQRPRKRDVIKRVAEQGFKVVAPEVINILRHR
jgi:DNA repair exonuclease SbcCD ATPase subunit